MSQDPDYIKKLDSLARFYNSQVTAHVGYFITSVVLYFTIFGIVQPTKTLESVLGYLGIEVHPLVPIVVVVAIFFLFLPVWIWLPFSSRYQLARTQYYMQLSEIVWEHMGVNNPMAFGSLEKRAKSDYTSIQASVCSLFEARLFRSLWRKERGSEPPEMYNGREWMDVFNLGKPLFTLIEKPKVIKNPNYEEIKKSEEYGMFVPSYYSGGAGKERKILRIWNLFGFDYTGLLWTAHRGTIKTYPENYPVFLLFKDFLD